MRFNAFSHAVMRDALCAYCVDAGKRKLRFTPFCWHSVIVLAMRLFIGYESALRFWQSAWSDSVDLDAPSSIRSLRYAGNNAGHVQEFPLKRLGFCEGPIDLLVPEANMRCHSTVHRTHVWAGPIAAGSFFMIGKDTFVSSPEFTFLQIAAGLDPVRAVKMGYELCGRYRGDDLDVRGFIGVKPRTSVKKLAKYADRMNGSYGVKTMRSAIRRVADNSASPAETALVMLLCMPKSFGGYGLPLAELNVEISMDGRESRMAGHNSFRCDLLWRRFALAVEYDSDMFHTGREKIADDSERRNMLGFLGLNVITVTRRQLYSVVGMQSVAEQINKAMSRKGVPNLEFDSRAMDLRRLLLYG